jgi:hypothetical protein
MLNLDSILSFVNKTAAQAFGVSLMSGAFLALRDAAWFGFERLPDYSEPVAGILLLVSGSVWAGFILKLSAEFVRLQFNTRRLRRAADERRARVIASLADINDREWRVLAYLVTNNRPHFVAPMNDANLTPLIKKGILVYTGSGVENILAYPYAVPDFVWDIIKSDQRMLDEKFRRNRAPWGLY